MLNSVVRLSLDLLCLEQDVRSSGLITKFYRMFYTGALKYFFVCEHNYQPNIYASKFPLTYL